MTVLETFRGFYLTGVISVPTVVDSALGRVTPERCDRRLDWWSRTLLEEASVELCVRGREHAGAGAEAFIVMSNHQSLYDIPVLFRAVPGRLRMVAKAELFRVPVWGKAMLASGFVRIDRSDREQAVESLLGVGGSLLASGTRVWIAPEGTRSKTGEVGPFKSGGFRMALDTHTRILPVAIDGTRQILPAKGFVVQKGKRVRVVIRPPIDPAAYGLARRKELMADVRASIIAGLSPPPSAGAPLEARA